MAVAFSFTAMPLPCQSAALSRGYVLALARRCAPALNRRVLVAVAQVESHFDPLAMHNNTKHLSLRSRSKAAAVAQGRNGYYGEILLILV